MTVELSVVQAQLALGQEAGHLASLDVQLALGLCRLSRCAHPQVATLLALASAALGQGHVCLPLHAIDRLWPYKEGELNPQGQVVADWLATLRVAAPEDLQGLLLESGLASGEDQQRPLVLQRGRLYFRRYFEHEVAVAADLRERREITHAHEPWMDEAVAGLFAQQEAAASAGQRGRTQMTMALMGVAEPDRQREAAEATLARGLTVISGGPGTGKTSTVVKILALLVEQALRKGQAPPRLALLAPTGKAAARLSEAIVSAREKLPVEEHIKQAIHHEATTIHRALGVRPSGVFERNRSRPLQADVVLVDEASMVDLSLMRRLLDAVPLAARLILLGDRDQLASVEAGAVLGDICGLHLTQTERATHGLSACIVQLEKSYRYKANSGIGRLAAAIRQGRTKESLELLYSSSVRDVELKPALRGGLGEAAEELLAHYRPYLQVRTAEHAHERFNTFRVLCAHRRGEGGVEWLNQQLELLLARNRLIRRQGPFYHGRPVMITRNDPTTRLYNGDIGLIWSIPEGEAPQGSRSGVAAIFPSGNDGALRALSPSRLPQHESVYAMTVHKSQGAEFDRVLVVLPNRITPLLCRELLYTAVTRARKHVTIYGDAEVIRAAVEQPVQRLSGLSERLWSQNEG